MLKADLVHRRKKKGKRKENRIFIEPFEGKDSIPTGAAVFQEGVGK